MPTRRVTLPALVALLLLPLTTAGPLPSAPEDLVATGGVGRIDLSWSPPGDAGLGVTGYRVYRDGAPRALVPANVTSYVDAPLGPSEAHAYAVRAVTLLLEGEAAEATGTTSATPLPPTGLVAVGGHRSVDLRWTPHGGDAFRVYRDGDLVAEVANASHLDDGLADATRYAYEVTALHAGHESARSASANATTQGPPGAPRNLTARGGPAAIVLSWSPPSTREGNLSYRVYAEHDGGTLVGETDRTNFTDAPVPAGETRTYVVRAVNVVGEGDASNEATATAIGPPGPPRDLQAEPTDAGIRLAWRLPEDDGGANVTGHRVYLVDANGTRALLAVTRGNATSYDDDAAPPNATRTYVVTAINAAGEGPESNEATATRGAGSGRPASSGGDAHAGLPLRVRARIDADA